MNWERILYGSDNISKSKKYLINILIVFSLLTLYGAYADFIPSEKCKNISTILSVILTLSITIIVYWDSFLNDSNSNIYHSDYMKILSYMVLPFALFVIIWIGITHGISDIYTVLFGSKKYETVYLNKNHTSGRRQCRFRLTGSILDDAFPSYYCIPETYYEKLPSLNEYRLEGVSSIFGFHINEIYALNINYKQ